MVNFNNRIKKILNEYITEKDNLNDNFNNWFKGSKIVENGSPLICYHGTNEPNIGIFNKDKIGHGSGNYGHYGYGFYFSTDIREAKTYGEYIYECYLRILNPFTGTDKQILQLKNKGVSGIDELIITSIDFNSFKNSFKDKPKIFDFIKNVEKFGNEKAWDIVVNNNQKDYNLDMLNDISNIIDYTTLNSNVYGVPDYILDDLKTLGIKPKLNKGFPYSQSLHWITDLGKRSKEVTEVIKELGYDGVWYGSEIVVFNPNQIKSIKNNGEWKFGNDNIFS